MDTDGVCRDSPPVKRLRGRSVHSWDRSTRSPPDLADLLETRRIDSVSCATVNRALPSLGAIVNTSMKLSLVSSILPLLILTSYSSGTTAQTGTPAARAPIVSSDSGATPPPVVAPGPAAKAPAKNGTGAGAPVGNGRWVNRIDKKTCPNGSTAYVDERDGGVKCWVEDR